MRHPSQLGERDQADTLLRGFFERESADKSDATQSRYRRVQQQLADFLDEGDMSRSLDSHENAVLAAARRNSRGFLDAFGLEELVACLPRFVEHDWLLDQTTDARTQVMLVGRLLAWLDDGGHLDHELLGCALYEAQAAVRAAKALLQPGSKRPTTQTQPRQRPTSAVEPPGTTGPSRPALTLIRGGRAEH